MDPFTARLAEGAARVAVGGAEALTKGTAGNASELGGLASELVQSGLGALFSLPEVVEDHGAELRETAPLTDAARAGAGLVAGGAGGAGLGGLTRTAELGFGPERTGGPEGLRAGALGELSDWEVAAPVEYVHAWDPESFDGVGDPEGAAECWQKQEGNSCAVMSEVGVIEYLTGEHLTEAEATAICETNGWYDPASGTRLEDCHRLLVDRGLSCESRSNASLDDLVDALERGDQVIVGLDASEIWYPQRDAVTGERVPVGLGYGHAVWITGVDTDAAGNVTVIMNDTGHPDGKMRAVALEDFLAGWDSYGNFLITVPDPREQA